MSRPERIWLWKNNATGMIFHHDFKANGTAYGDEGEYIRADLAIEKALIFSCDKCGDKGKYCSLCAMDERHQQCVDDSTCKCTEKPHSIYSIKKGVTK
jgi:hypothetical protein